MCVSCIRADLKLQAKNLERDAAHGVRLSRSKRHASYRYVMREVRWLAQQIQSTLDGAVPQDRFLSPRKGRH